MSMSGWAVRARAWRLSWASVAVTAVLAVVLLVIGGW